MLPRVIQAKQVWQNAVDRIRDLKFRAREGDDTVESQAHTFRIWMWSSTVGLGLIVIVTVLSGATNPTETPVAPVESSISMFDQLPEGYMVAPIEPTNLDSLDSMFDQHGYADLYKPEAGGGKGKRIARGVPLIRAPKNPRRFAVLIAESQTATLANLADPVLVILRKKPAKVYEEPDEKPKSRSRLRDVSPSIDVIEEALPASAQNLEPGVQS